MKELDTVRLYGRAEDERWHLRNDGSRFFASGVVTKMKDGKSGYVKIARDMTQNRILEQQKDEFIVVASHELKTPVTSIKAYAEVLLEQLEDEGHEETLGMVRKLNKQVDRLSGLINDLLDTTKISEGQLMLNPEKFDLNKLIQECRDNFMRIAFNHKIDIDAGKIPEVYADRERIEQVLTNLLSNAIKYSPNGGKINITSRLNNGNIQVQVTDNGIGISEEAQKMLFSKFFRSKSSTISTYPGLGLGLYISAEIIKRHNGSIAVESHKDNGSTFVFTLPLGVP